MQPPARRAPAAATSPEHHHVLVLADDFTGACEVSLPWKSHGYGTAIALDASAARSTQVHIIDTNTRGVLPAEAAATTAETLASFPPTALLIKKIDSLWRGNIPAELLALSQAGYRLVIAGALPHLGRSVRNGAPLIQGVPLAATDAWSIEISAPPELIGDLLVGLSTRHLPRPGAGGQEWETYLAASLHETQAIVIDCETETDLTTIADECLRLLESTATPIALVGTGALNAAIASAFAAHFARDAAASAELSATTAPWSATSDGPHPLFGVVGSASGRSGQQLAHARDAGMVVTENTADLTTELLGGNVGLLAASATPGDPAAILTTLRHNAALLLENHPSADLFLTGGETARAILDDQNIDTLYPLLQLEPGVVICRTPAGRLVGTKPGTFGSTGILTQSLNTLRELRTITPQEHDPMTKTLQDTRPYIAVTMGDGAGVGPEVTVGALIDERAYATSRPVVIGDAYRLRLGATALGATVEIAEIETISEAIFIPGRINVIDPHLLSPDLPWGKESAEAGNAAYHYIRIACELGMRGEVQGICTAPLNKAALHSAGHIYPGHTELLAHFMGIEEVSMMLSTPKVKVIHVTTHIGLIDAINKIEPGLVERTVRRGHDALVRAGNANPKIGVCAINPHAGENGLFGYGEEETKIIPALEKLRADGINAAGPLPADTAFFLAGRGDYDLIVAMYHDQGHGPVKVLGIEAGVNITVGLPVIRTSVDHGTAFDIAGTGVVEVGSMIEALTQAVNLASVPAL
ncbi:4-hydroxythreonine-4-phosphate dehydrogenase PdxA [Paeniglutamicibacter sp. Y32M11]|uniref:4-hydroxythreonine-4-phosphate dehydrogenase PdxA n=1 Tax=Paeniglutamicibacter sp. Y32M11 TaxID=2853258 RepID=UPI001C52DBAE|nr:4-hydroxythreonine-4-phosphate dehydrogenase PdxA [Paeniglutamicibacter sp. Y32M11]QXQ10078.1 4-hydroxythreonine-4-phosphate dehydrogenase PdxA [Paeniglutamicibacter sp. Y32M11]